MADRIAELYQIASKKGVLAEGLTEEMFREQTKTDEGLRSFYDYASQNGMNLTEWPTFRGKARGEIMDDLPQQPQQPQQPSSAQPSSSAQPAGVSGGSLLDEQAELARQNAYQGVTNDPNQPFVEQQTTQPIQGRELKMDEVIRPKGYENLTDEQLDEQIAQLSSNVHEQKARELYKARYGKDYVEPEEPKGWWERYFGNKGREYANERQRYAEAVLDASRIEELDNPGAAKRRNEQVATLKQEKAYRDRQVAMPKLGEEIKDLQQRILSNEKQDGNDMRGAKHLLNQTIDLYNAPSKYGRGSGIANWGQGLADQITDYDTWTAGVTELVRYGNLNGIVNKMNKGGYDTLTKEEQLLLETFLMFTAVQDMRSDLSTGYEIGKGAAESIPFMVEMYLTAGAGAAAKRGLVQLAERKVGKAFAEKLARSLGGTAIRDAAGNLVERGATQTVAGKVGKTFAYDFAQTAAMPSTYSNIYKDRVTEILQGDGNYGFKDLARSFTGQMVETGTERWGGRLIDRGMSKMIPIDATALWGKNKLFGHFVENYINSPIGQTGEEVIAAGVNTLRSLNPLYYHTDDKSVSSNKRLRGELGEMLTPEGLGKTFLTILPMSIFGGGANAAINRMAANAVVRNYGQSRQALQSLLESSGATPEEANRIVNQIEASDSDRAFFDKMNMAYNYLLNKYMMENPNAPIEDVKAYQQQLDQVLGDYTKQAGAYNQMVGDLMEKYEKLSDNEKRTVDSAMEDYMVRAAEEFASKQQPQDRQTQLRQQAAQQAQQDVQGMAHQDGNVYYVGIKGKDGSEGYAVSGNLNMQQDDKGMYSTSGRDLVTVKMNDGSVQQVPADELVVRDLPVSANELIQERTDHYFAQYANNDLFHVGDKVYIKQNGQQSAESSTIVNINDEGIEVEIIDPNGQPNTTIIPHEQAAEMLSKDETGTEDGIVTYTMQDGNTVRLRDMGYGTFASIVSEGEQPEIFTEEELAEAGAVRAEENSGQGEFVIPQEEGYEYGKPTNIRTSKKGTKLADITRTHIDKDGNKVTEVITIKQDGTNVISGSTLPLVGYRIAGMDAETFDGVEVVGFTKLTELPQRTRVVDGRDADGNNIYREQDAVGELILKDENGKFSATVPLIRTDDQSSSPITTGENGNEAPVAAPTYPTDEEGNPAWGQIEVPQAAQILYDTFKQNNTAAISYADDQLKEAEKVQKQAAKQKSHSLNIAQRIAEDEQNAQFKAAADAAVKYWQDVKLAIGQIKTAEEQDAKEAQQLAMQQAREQRSKTEEGTVTAPTMAERYAAADKIEGNTGTMTLPDGHELSGRYMLIAPQGVTPSHDVSKNYQRSEGYPVTSNGQSINDRDYTADKEEQQKVVTIAQNFNGNAIKNMPVISDEGLVYNGNGRMMAGQLAALNGTDAAYTQSLMNNAAQYGFTPEQVASIPNARVVFQLDERLPYSTQSLAIFNEQETQTQSNTGKAAGYARKLTPQAVSEVLAAVDGFNTIDAFFSDKKAPFNLINSLINAGIIAQREKAEMVDGDKLSATGRERLSNILFGTVFDNETIRLMGDDAALKNSILRALPQILENKSLGEFSLESDINDAIRLLYQVRNSGMPFRSFVSQTVIAEDGEVHTAAENYSPYQLLLAEEMTDGGVDAFRDVLNLYNEQAKTIQGGQVDIFGNLPTPTELKNLILQRYGKEPTETERPSAGRQTDNSAEGAPASNEPAAEQITLTDGRVVTPATIKREDFALLGNISPIQRALIAILANKAQHPDWELSTAGFGNDARGLLFDELPDKKSDLKKVEDIYQQTQEEYLAEPNKTAEYRLAADDVLREIWRRLNYLDSDKWSGGQGAALISRLPDAETPAESTPEERLAQAEAETDTNPTEAQKKAENYKQGHVTLWGLPITIENPKGSIRRGTDANGKQWEQEMHHTYGKIRRTEGVDGDHIDVFIGPNLTSDKVFVVDQRNVDTGEFDEHKVMLGFDSLEEAQNGYLSNYEEGWQGMGTVTEVTMDEFKKWIDSSHRKTKPFAEYRSVKTEGAASTAMEEQPDITNESAQTFIGKDVADVRKALGHWWTLDSQNAGQYIFDRAGYGRLQLSTDEKGIVTAAYFVSHNGPAWFAAHPEQEQEQAEPVRAKHAFEVTISDINGFIDRCANNYFKNYALNNDALDTFYDQQVGKHIIAGAPYVDGAYILEVLHTANEELDKLKGKRDKYSSIKKRVFSNLVRDIQAGLSQSVSAAPAAPTVTEQPQAPTENRETTETQTEDLTPLEAAQKRKAAREAAKAAEPKNTIFTDEAYEKAKARMKARLNRLNMGIDPEMVADQIVIAGYHVERGARKFADFARALIADFGDGIRQYARQMYNYLRDIPEGEPFRAEMDDYATVMAFDIDNFDKNERKNAENAENILINQNNLVTLQPNEKEYAADGLSVVVNTQDYTTYLTPQAKEVFAKLGQKERKPHKRPELSYISFASRDGVMISLEVLKSDPAIIEAQAKIDSTIGSLELTQEQIEEYANRLLEGGDIKSERKAFIIIGRPAGGKSSVFAEPLAEQNSARIIDSDEVKPWLDGYDNGDGAGYVQKASDLVMQEALWRAALNGDNVVIPKIGGGSIIDEITLPLKELGYTVELYYNEVAPESSYMRAMARFAEKGRYLSLNYLAGIGDKPTKTFNNYSTKDIYGTISELSSQKVQDLRARLARIREMETRLLPERLGRGGRSISTLGISELLESGELGRGRDSQLTGTPLFDHYEWKNNDVPFGTKPKTIKQGDNKPTHPNGPNEGKKATFEKGQKVKYRNKVDGKLYDATIDSVNADGTYNLLSPNPVFGDVFMGNISEDRISPIEQPAEGENVRTPEEIAISKMLGTITKSKHTKTGEDLYVVSIPQRVSDDEFKVLKARAKANNGYYSSFAKNRGFVFKDYEDAKRFNTINDEEVTDAQTSANTEAIISQAETGAAEAASIGQDGEDRSGAEGEQRTEDAPASVGAVGTVKPQAQPELSPEEADAAVTECKEAISKIDETVEHINEQLAVLGYYQADETKDFHEYYGYMKSAEKKAVVDADKLGKQLATDLGIEVNKRKKVASANLSQIGGDVKISLPLPEGRELNIWISVRPNAQVTAANGHRDDGTTDSLVVQSIMWRVDHQTGYGSNNWEWKEVTYQQLLKNIRRIAKNYLPEVKPEQVDVPELPANPTMMDVVKQATARKEAIAKKRSKNSIPDGQQVLDLFADVVDEINDGIAQENSTPAIEEQTEPINNEDNGSTEVRNDGERESSAPQGRTAGQPADQNGTLGGSQRQANEGTQSGGLGSRSEQHRVHDGERGLGTAGQRSTESVETPTELDEIGQKAYEKLLKSYKPGLKSELEKNISDTEALLRGEHLTEELRSKLQGELKALQELLEKANAKNTHNFRYDPANPAPMSNRARYEANLAAIRLLKQLQDEDRQATPEEQRVLAKFTGWGGLGEFFKGEPGTTYWSDHGEKSPYQVIKELLTDEEMQAAQLSRNSAYFTPPAIIDELWNVAKHLGFKGGNILEGSAGIGNILSQMPQSISDRSNLQAVEIDTITAGILAQLYPDAQTHAAGFQEVDIPNNSQDLVITNVPFVTGLRVYDKKEKDLSKRFGNIHDFCIAKNVRKLRQGGLGIFITTSGTLDSSKDLRRWLNNEGETDVIGAFRLNRETFGGTSATSDIIVVRKRVNGQKDPRAIDVLDTDVARVAETEEDGKNVEKKLIYNRYFVEHPESMGGEMGFGFEHGDTRWGGTTSGCYPSPAIDQGQRLQEWVEAIPTTGDVQTVTVRESNNFNPGTYEEYHGDLPYGSLVLNSKGEICRVYNGMVVPVEGINPTKVKGHTKAEVLTDYNALKAAVEELLAEQAKGISDEGLKGLLRKLNKAYDDFVKKYGYLNRNVSLSFLRNDVQWASMAALENVRETIDKNGKKQVEVSKTDVFSKRVVGVQAEPKAENARDGVILSVQQYGNVRPDMIAMWLERPQEDVEKEIIESRLAFRDPQTGNMVVSHEYLSGNVREKLAYADEHNENGIYDTNIEELRKVIPVDIPAHLIEFNIGSTWIPVELYHQYLKEKFGVESLQLVHVGSAWISNEKSYGGYALRNEKNRAEGVYSEKLMEQVYGHQLMIAAMNNVPVVVSKTEKHSDGTTKTITDKEATAACSDKISQIKDDFVEWARGKMQEDSELAERVQKIYNERFNAIVPMLSVDKAFLSPHLPGQNYKYTLYDHQQQAVVRATTQPVMLAHEVGTGKTITLISSAMEMRRLGTAKKPMIVVQNATTPQFVKEAKDLYPNAKILTVSERDRTKEGRQEFYAKIKYNDWDLIIVPQSVFDMIPDSESRMRDFIQEKIDEKMHAIEAAKEANVDEKVTKRMERELEALQEDLQNANMSGKRSKSKTEKDAKKDAERIENAKARAEEMLDRRTDEVEDFDDMGIDALLIDEAHNYKHLGFATMMTRGVKGIDPSYSKRAAALYLKCQSVYERCGHRNVVFATGTPISNTAAEIWTFMKYLMPKEVLKDNDIYYFDDFVHNFGKINEQLEFATNGKFKANNRFAQYGNVPELMRIWLTCADCVLTREVGQVNDKVPEMEGGKAQDIFLPQSPSLIDIMASVRAELERYEQMSGKEKRENSHIPLTMYGVAKRAAIDPRLVDASAADEPLSKTNKAVEETLRSLKETKKYNGTVAIFCDSYRNLQTGFNLFEDIKAKLVKAGVPAAKIAIIRSEMTDAAKQKIFDAVREGEIRVIMGSTQTLGTGVNIQTRLHTLIHMDAPDRPMDYTQRNGRIIRQGNMHRQWNLPVRVLRFGVEDSLDVTSYQRLKTKAGFIDSIMNGKSMIDNNLENRVLEDVEEGIFDNPVAMLSGSQYALLKSQAERDLRKWQARKQQHDIDQILIAKKLKDNAQIIEHRRQLIATDEQFLQTLQETFPTGKVTEYNIDGTICHNAAELKEAVKAINADIQARADKLRKEGYEGSKQNIAVSLQFNGMPFNVNIVLTYNSRWESGQRAITINKEVQFTTPTTDKWLNSPTKVLDKLIEHIEQDYLSGTQATGEINYSRSYIERLQQENELMRQREGKPFEHSADLEKAQALVDEYTEKMQDELAEKEAKYANMSSGRAVTLNEQDDEEETPEAQITNLNYPQFANQTEAQQLATAALVEVLNDNTDLDVSLATDEQMPEDGSEKETRRDRDGFQIGDGTWHMPYEVRQFPDYPQIEARVSKASTTESVYVTYTNKNNGESVKVRFSGHMSNNARWGVDLPGFAAENGQILERLGLAKREWQGNSYVPVRSISKAELAAGNYEVADKTRAELSQLPIGTDISEYKGKLVPDMTNNAIYTSDKVVEDQYNGRRIYRDANGNIIPSGRTREAMLTPDGTLYGWAIGDRIYLTKDGLNPNSPIHEYSHIWAKAMMRNNREGWQSIVDIFKGTPFWDEVVNDPNYQGLTTDDAICSEVVARYSSPRGAARMEEWAKEEQYEAEQSGSLLRGAKVRQLINRAKQALADFWHWVGVNLFGIKHFDSAEQVADRVLFDMLNGTELDLTPEREMQHIKERAIADGTFMQAPNGNPTKLNERQWLLVRTQAFKRWFGDWENDPANASKVVDENGEPMVVYRGGEMFTVYDPAKASKNAMYGQAYYASPVRYAAEMFAEERTGDKDNVQGVFMNIRKPYIDDEVEDFGYPQLASKAEFDALIDALKKKGLNDRRIERVVANHQGDKVGLYPILGTLSDAFFEGRQRGAFEYWSNGDVVNETLRELGYDGVIGMFTPESFERFSQAAAFYPNQIKSATDNNGEFSTEDDDIERSVSKWTPEQMRAIQEWNDAHPHPQYNYGETLDHYKQRLDKWEEERKRFREQLQALRPSNASASTAQSERISQNQAPAFVPGVRPTPMANETPYEYALRLRQYYQLMRDERLVAEYVAEINNQADAAAKVLKKNTIVRGLLDAAKPIENFQEWMKQHGATITDESNAYTDTFLATGRVTEANEQMQRDIIRPLAKQIAKIIAPDAKTGKSRLDGINIVWHNMDVAGTGSKLDGKALTPREIIGVYCQAKDCAEAIEKGLPDRGAKGFLNNLGMSHDDIITAVESVIPRAELDELWRLINAATHFALNYDYESGRISEDTHTEFYQREFYVPQRGWRERDESGLITDYEPVGKRGNDPYNAALVKAHGRQSLASDPFAYIMSIDASSIVSSENNKIKQKFLQFCLDNEDLGLQTGAFRVKKYWIMNVIDPETGKIKLDEEGNPMMEVSYVAPSAEDLSHDRTIKELIKKKRKEWAKVNQAYLERQSHGELGPQLEAAYKTKLSKIEQAIEDLEQQMHIAWNATNTNITQRTSDEKKQHEVRVLLDGQEYLIEVQDEKLANAINKKFKQHQEQLFNTSQKMRNTTRFMSAVLTQYNPEFAASNFARDFQVALATLTAEHPELVGSFLKNFAACQPAVWIYAFNDKVRDRAVFRDSELGRYLQEYFKAGAATGFSYMQDLKSLRQDFDAMINESNLRRGIKGAVGVFSMLTEVSETAVRFAGYVAARQKGMGINEAAYLSKELTTNFDRAGEVADSGWMSWFSFFRATLNGNIKFLKALKKMPVAYSIIAAAYVAMGMLNQFLNPDDPDDEVWAGDYTRESNFVIGKWRIPTAHFLRMFFAAGVNAAKWMQGEKSFGEATYNTANFASQELLPNYLNLLGNGTEWNSREGKVDFTWEGLLQGVMPSPVSPIADVYFNRDFRGATINREPFAKSQEGTKDILLSKENTLPVYKWLTQAIYEGVGGNMNAKYQSDDPAWRSWLFDTSASSVEHVVEGYMPAGMDMFITLGEAIYDAATGTPTGPDKWPFVRKFYNAYTPERAYMQQYYLLNGRVKEFKRNMDDYRKNDRTKYNILTHSQEYRNYQEAERLVKNQKENPSTADVQALIEANKQWLRKK